MGVTDVVVEEVDGDCGGVGGVGGVGLGLGSGVGVIVGGGGLGGLGGLGGMGVGMAGGMGGMGPFGPLGDTRPRFSRKSFNMDGITCAVDVATGEAIRLTEAVDID